MIPLPLAAGFCAILIISLGILHAQLETKRTTVRKLESLLTDSSRELASLEMLKSHFLNRIGNVLTTPLQAVKISSEELINSDSGLPEKILLKLRNLSEEVRSLIKILSVMEEISLIETETPNDNSPGTELVSIDDLVSDAAMNIADSTAEKMVSISVSICDTAEVNGRESQLSEAISSIFREALKRADPGTVLTIDLKADRNIELSTTWSNVETVIARDDVLGAGFIRLIASSHGGWLNVDNEKGSIILILPRAGENT